jgi:anti-sigma B factor antagonist
MGGAVTEGLFEIVVDGAAGELRLRLIGELDLVSVPTLRSCLENVAGDVQTVVLDCAELTFLDSTGIGLLIRCQRDLQERGGSLIIHSPKSHVRKVLEVTQVTRLVDIVEG